MDHCIDTIFSNNINLHENKRLKTVADKAILKQFKEDIFNESIPVIKTVKKYFKLTREATTTTNNIAYRNTTCESVAGAVRKMLKKTSDFEVDEVLVCRKYLKIKGGKCSVNFEYSVKAIKGDTITIVDLNGEKTFDINRELLKKHFIHSYCRTCHSFQGSSIEGKVTVFDWKFFFVNRKWIYTCATRATELKNVVFFDGSNDDFDESMLDKYLDKKVQNYKKQDHQHQRTITENYVTADWLKSQFGKTCQDCGDCLRFDIKDGKVESNLSADRVDNSECHHINNIVPLCVSCNQRKSCWW
jgi:hypothetical protein